jgi:transcriptional regulator with XRE-family HTH domain
MAGCLGVSTQGLSFLDQYPIGLVQFTPPGSTGSGVERNFVSLIERGKNQPTIRVVFKLAEALKTSPARLVELTEEEVKHQ